MVLLYHNLFIDLVFKSTVYIFYSYYKNVLLLTYFTAVNGHSLNDFLLNLLKQISNHLIILGHFQVLVA